MTPIPGLPAPSPLLAQYYTLQAAIASGAKTVRFQDRTIEYQSLDEMVKASNYLFLQLASTGAVPGGAGMTNGGVNRQVRMHTSKGL
jgi:hypothetical protein